MKQIMSIDYKKFENEEIEFNDDTINLIKCIGHGGNSVVYKCKYKDDYYAIKFFIGNKKVGMIDLNRKQIKLRE